MTVPASVENDCVCACPCKCELDCEFGRVTYCDPDCECGMAPDDKAPPTVPAPIHKTCWRCDIPKPVTAFHWRNRARGVRHSSCKACRCRDERLRYDEREFDRIYLGGAGPRPLPAIAPTNPPLPWGYGMTSEDVAAVNEAAEGARHIPATTPASVMDPADACADPDPMGDGSAWGWVTVATIGALGVLVGIVVWVAA